MAFFSSSAGSRLLTVRYLLLLICKSYKRMHTLIIQIQSRRTEEFLKDIERLKQVEDDCHNDKDKIIKLF